MNQQDLNAMTEFWHRETNHLNDSIDSAFKSAQDDAYARGHRRGREDLIDIRKQRDELLAAMQKAADEIRRCDYTPARSTLLTTIASVKGQQ